MDEQDLLLSAVPLLTESAGRALVQRHCDSIRLPIEVFDQLVATEVKHHGQVRRHGLFIEIHSLLQELADKG